MITMQYSKDAMRDVESMILRLAQVAYLHIDITTRGARDVSRKTITITEAVECYESRFASISPKL